MVGRFRAKLGQPLALDHGVLDYGVSFESRLILGNDRLPEPVVLHVLLDKWLSPPIRRSVDEPFRGRSLRFG